MSENTNATSPAVTTKRCLCGLYTGADGETTGCERQTNSKKRDFLPGHDAKLKGLLIRAKHAAASVVLTEGDTRTETDAVTAASRFGFASLVANATPRKKAASPDSPCLAEIVADEEAKDEAAEIAAAEAMAAALVAAAPAAPKPRASRPRKATPARA